MKLPGLAIKNHHFTLIVIILLVVFGVYSFITMPRTEDPQIAIPGASVTVAYPGASPIDLEHLVVAPLEEALNELEDVKAIDSYSGDGLANVSVEFSFGTDPDEKYREFVEKVASVRPELPEEVLSLETFKWEVGSVNILQLALVSETAAYAELERTAEELKDRLERISGVRQVEILACPEQQVQVRLDPERMALMRIPINQVIGAIQSSNTSIPGGSIDSGGRKLNIRTSGMYQSLEDIRRTVVHTSREELVYLEDIATVRIAAADLDYHARFSGRRAIFITLNQKDRTNIFSIMSQVDPVIEEFKETLPPTMQLFHAFRQAESVAERFNLFFSNLLQGIVLVGLIVFLGVGLRSTVLVVMAIPLSLFIGIGFVHLSGFGLEQISIGGLVIVLGILVDNAIVVTENINRHLHLGYSPNEAAVRGASQVAWAITSATATTVLAFVPLIAMQDKAGQFIRSLPLTVVFTLSASLFLALTFNPYLASRVLSHDGAGRKSWMQRRLERFIGGSYSRFLDWCLSRPAAVLGVALAALLSAVLVFVFLVGVSFFPKAEKPQFLINVKLPQGASIDQTDRAVHFVEQVLAERPEIELFAANIGHGNPRIYYNVVELGEMSSYGQLFVQLKGHDRSRMGKLLEELRARFDGYPGARIEIKELEQGPPLEAPIAIKVLSNNLDELEALSRDVERIIISTPQVMNVHNPLSSSETDLKVNINREKAAILGLPLIDIDKAVRAGLSGLTVSTYRDQAGKNYDIVCRLNARTWDNKPAIGDFEHLYVSSRSGEQIPLEQVATIEFETGPVEIRHYNLERSVTVTADVQRGYSVDEATGRIIRQLEAYDWPRGSRFYAAGELESREESFGGMGVAIVVAMISIFGVLVLQFRSFSQPFIIFSALPLAFIGSVVALLVTGYTFSFTAFVGLTSLVGIVVNDAIILVDFANQLVREGKGLMAAIKEAARLRFISIILTSATTIAGLLPLTLRGGTLWAPMGLTIIGGLFTSTALTLIVVPVLYKLFFRSPVGGEVTAADNEVSV